MADVGDGQRYSRFRVFTGRMTAAQKLLLASAPIIGLLYNLNAHFYVGLAGLWKEQYVGLFLVLVLAAVFLNTKATKRSSPTRVPWYDCLLIFLSLCSGAYIVVLYPREMMAGLTTTPENVILGAVLVMLALEAARRLLGWVFVILTSVFVFYAAYANIFPGLLAAKATRWPFLITHLYLDPTSFLFFVGIAAGMVLPFILFGQGAFSFGAAKVLGDFALSIMGRYRGGPAKVSVLGSSLFGTMSGSAVSNIVVVGSVTIPLMKRIGYQPHFAAAVEAAASNGGPIMPPVMGIVAFIMANMIGVPYAVVAVAAVVPAVLYFFALFVQVDLEAARAGLKGLPPHEIPPLRPVLKKAWVVLLPVACLIITMFVIKLPPALAAAYSTIFSFLVSATIRENRTQYWQRLMSVFTDTGSIMLNVAPMVICAGFVVAAVGISGLGTKMSVGMVALGGGNTLSLLAIAAVASIILGMGLPASASYILVAILVAPALVRLGIPLLAAHLFVMYYANSATITPPIALGVFVAAPMAGADPMRTGYAAMRLSVLSFVVPFLFVFSPALLLQGPPWLIAVEVATALVGTFALGVGLSGYFVRPLSWIIRLLSLAAALALFISVAVELMPEGVALKFGGLLFLTLLAAWEWKQNIKKKLLAGGAS